MRHASVQAAATTWHTWGAWVVSTRLVTSLYRLTRKAKGTSVAALFARLKALAQFEALQLAGGGLGERIQKFNPLGALIRGEALGGELLQLLCEFRRRVITLARCDVNHGAGEAVGIAAGDGGGIQNGGVL